MPTFEPFTATEVSNATISRTLNQEAGCGSGGPAHNAAPANRERRARSVAGSRGVSGGTSFVVECAMFAVGEEPGVLGDAFDADPTSDSTVKATSQEEKMTTSSTSNDPSADRIGKVRLKFDSKTGVTRAEGKLKLLEPNTLYAIAARHVNVALAKGSLTRNHKLRVSFTDSLPIAVKAIAAPATIHRPDAPDCFIPLPIPLLPVGPQDERNVRQQSQSNMHVEPSVPAGTDPQEALVAVLRRHPVLVPTPPDTVLYFRTDMDGNANFCMNDYDLDLSTDFRGPNRCLTVQLVERRPGGPPVRTRAAVESQRSNTSSRSNSNSSRGGASAGELPTPGTSAMAEEGNPMSLGDSQSPTNPAPGTSSRGRDQEQRGSASSLDFDSGEDNEGSSQWLTSGTVASGSAVILEESSTGFGDDMFTTTAPVLYSVMASGKHSASVSHMEGSGRLAQQAGMTPNSTRTARRSIAAAEEELRGRKKSVLTDSVNHGL